MKLIRTYPVTGLNRVSDFDDWFRNPFTGFPANLSRLAGWDKLFNEPGPVTLAADIHEDRDHYYARFEIPGVRKEDVKIELSNNLLTVSAEKKEKQGDEESSFSLTRSISVPDTVKADAISAKLEDGILTVTLPKTEERKPRNIQVS
ncbi:MAG: Hsp20/alpha crystallin family protein [Verrucomicrobia bacterium]|nr:Hsp20/alpha crystallin family protein [Verrucomicrobiota bacterium]